MASGFNLRNPNVKRDVRLRRVVHRSERCASVVDRRRDADTLSACWQLRQAAPRISSCARAAASSQPLRAGRRPTSRLSACRAASTIDLADLERRYYALSRALHPGSLSRPADAPSRRRACARAPLVNRAYRTLRDPVARGRYWLELHGESLGRDNNRVPPALAALVFEVQEKLEELRAARADGASARAAEVERARDEPRRAARRRALRRAARGATIARLGRRRRRGAGALAELKATALGARTTCARCCATSTRSWRTDVERIVGIDLGTTNSLVAVLDDDGAARASPTRRRARDLLPSVGLASCPAARSSSATRRARARADRARRRRSSRSSASWASASST